MTANSGAVLGRLEGSTHSAELADATERRQVADEFRN
jgi:hypothetical protein